MDPDDAPGAAARLYYRVTYDFARTNWLTYGHHLYLETDDPIDAAVAIRALEGVDVTISGLEIRPAAPGERERDERLRAQLAAWLENVRTGTANTRGSV